MITHRQWALVLALAATPQSSQAELLRRGAEFCANETALNHQHAPTVGVLDSGEAVVVWESLAPPQVLGRLFSREGTPLSPEFRISRTSALAHEAPDLATVSGEYVVVWSATRPFHYNNDILAQWYSGSEPATQEFLVSEGTDAIQQQPVVAAGDEYFAVAWTRLSSASDSDVYARVFSRNGVPASATLPLSSVTQNQQFGVTLAFVPPATFAAIWLDNGRVSGGAVVMARLFAPDGTLGEEFRVNVADGVNQLTTPSVSGLSSGGFSVVWTQVADVHGQGHTLERRFAALGNDGGLERELAAYPESSFFDTSVAAGPLSFALGAWTEPLGDGSRWAVFGSLLGEAVGEPQRFNTFTVGDQYRPDVAGNRAGAFVSCWNSSEQDGSGSGVFCQAFEMDGPVVAIPATSEGGALVLVGALVAAALLELRRRAGSGV